MRLTWTWLCLFVGAAAWATPTMWDLLPGSGEVAGWIVTPGADQKTATASGLYGLYGQAAPDLAHAGVMAAAQRVYRKDTRRLTVDLLRFATPAQAGAHYTTRAAEAARTKGFAALRGIGQNACQVRLCDGTRVLLRSGRYVGVLFLTSNSLSDATTLQAFARHIAGKIAAAR